MKQTSESELEAVEAMPSSQPSSHLRMRRVSPREETSARLAAASSALRERTWAISGRRPVAEALRTTVLELAELDDAIGSARVALGERRELRATNDYLARVYSFLNETTDAIMTAAFEPATDVRNALSETIERWEPQVPWDVVFEIAELADSDAHALIFEVSAAWDRVARGLVRRLMLGYVPV